MDLTKLGWNADLNQQFAPHHAKGLIPARVAVEDKHFYRVWTADAELLAQVTGKCFHDARRSNSNLPKVGDWVAVKLVPSEEKAMIQAILPRRTPLQCKPAQGRGLGRRKTRAQRGEGHDSGHPSATNPTLPQDDRPGRHRAYSRHEYRHGIPGDRRGLELRRRLS